MKMNTKKKTKWIPALIIILLIIIVLKAFDPRLTVSRYVIESDKINETIKIVHISDLHNEIFGDNQEKLIDKISNEEPDIIVLTGDFLDGSPSLGTELLLEGISGLAPAFYVTGNHEYPYIFSDGKELMGKYGVTFLKDEVVEITIKGNKLLVAGINDPAASLYGAFMTHENLKNIFQDIQSNPAYTILLAHRPEKYEEYMEYGFDLVLSGHTHGGQVRIPILLNGLFAPNQGYFPKRAGGIYKDGDMNHIVSRGTTRQNFKYNNITIPRIFNPPEICVIELKKT